LPFVRASYKSTPPADKENTHGHDRQTATDAIMINKIIIKYPIRLLICFVWEFRIFRILIVILLLSLLSARIDTFFTLSVQRREWYYRSAENLLGESYTLLIVAKRFFTINPSAAFSCLENKNTKNRSSTSTMQKNSIGEGVSHQSCHHRRH